ncbi:MAG: CTP synthase, partial [Eubacterium sp.]|nr:CTP synthase [Eubacterium sp.]
GKIYWSVLNKERHGDYGGGTVQVIPHITNEIKDRFQKPRTGEDNEIAIIEVGGTVGDIESQPFLESIRQFQAEVGRENAVIILVSLIPYLRASGEMKTKPTQMSVKTLQSMGIWPDILVCRSDYPLEEGMKEKLALFCNVKKEHVLENLDADSLYEVPIMMEKEHLAKAVCDCLNLHCPEPDLSDWNEMLTNMKEADRDVDIAIVGKYVALHDAYLSVVESLKHGGIANRVNINLRWIESEDMIEGDGLKELEGVDGILVPGGFGTRGTEGKIEAIRYARENNIPFLGLCLGMQLAIVEFVRNVVGIKDADSIELNPDTKHPVIALMPDQTGVENIGGTLRLGAYPCRLKKDSLAESLYKKTEISERHRHRYEVNNDYRDILEEGGMSLSGISPDGRIVEMIEIPSHPFFIATQAHPEFKSRPNMAHPLFSGFVKAASEKKEDNHDE